MITYKTNWNVKSPQKSNGSLNVAFTSTIFILRVETLVSDEMANVPTSPFEQSYGKQAPTVISRGTGEILLSFNRTLSAKKAGTNGGFSCLTTSPPTLPLMVVISDGRIRRSKVK